MIRRRAGNDFWLITQHDHALLSGELARHYGNRQFTPLAPAERVLTGIALHDCGWPLHDDAPTIDANGFPLDVFESTREIAIRVWTASAERTAEKDPYAGLLVSLHVLSLSAIASHPTPNAESFELKLPKQKFELNRFQHGEIERQERLRAQLGLSNDIARRMGLAENPRDPREHLLTYDFRVLQAMDKLSLAICCTVVPNEHVEPLPKRPGTDGISLTARRPGNHTLNVNPWPFDVGQIEVTVPYRSVPAVRYASNAAFRSVYAAAKNETLTYVVRPA